MKRLDHKLKTDAQNFVRQTMMRVVGQQPSQKAIKQAADRIVRVLEPITSQKNNPVRTEDA